MKRKTRMYEPYGYMDENNYESSEIIQENDLYSFFSDVNYNKDDNKIHFLNKDGEEVGSLDVNEFVKSDSIIDHTEYKDGILKIYFTNGDIITIDLTKLLDENEFKDGLTVNGHVVKVLIDDSSDKYISVSENGVKVAGVEADIEAEKTRAEGEEQRIEAKLDDEIDRAISAETALNAKIDAEITRSTDEDARLDGKIDSETARAEAEEESLSRRIDTLNDELDAEESIREANDIKEENRATAAETALQAAISSEGQRAQDAETALDKKIDEESARAISAETDLAEGIEILGSNKFDNVVYDSSAKTITFYAEGNVKVTIDTTDFVKDGMIESVKIENGNLVITFNTESGKEPISIPLSDIFNPDNYYTKNEIDGIVSGLNASDEAILATVDNVSANVENEAQRAISAETDLQNSIELKADKETVYTQEQVDVMLAEKQTEIDKIISDYKKLKEIVGDLGGNVEYSVPGDGKLTDMLKKSGIIKLTEDVESNTYAGGITSKNITTLNLGGKTITTVADTTKNASIMTKGKEQFTIMGSGTLNANGHIAIHANSVDSVITLGGTAFGRPTYITNRNGGELIYCEKGTINITNGIFRNDGEDKSFTLNCYDANYKNGTAKIVVTGGKFYDFDPGNNTAEGPDTSFLAEGYHTEASTVVEEGVEHTVYTVKKNA